MQTPTNRVKIYSFLTHLLHFKWYKNPSYVQCMHTKQSSQTGRKKYLPTLYPTSVLPPLLGKLQMDMQVMYLGRGTAYRTVKMYIGHSIHWRNCWTLASLNTRPIVKLKWSFTLYSVFSSKCISTSSLEKSKYAEKQQLEYAFNPRG